MIRRSVLLADSNSTTRSAIGADLESHGWNVHPASGVREALTTFDAGRFSAAIVDASLPDGNFDALLERFRVAEPVPTVIVVAESGAIDLAVRTFDLGANQFLTRPVHLGQLRALLQLAPARIRDRHADAAAPARMGGIPDPFLGESIAIRRLEEDARRLLPGDRPLLLVGETGVGKRVLASWLHRHSARASEPYVDLNCAGLSREFLQRELFGHERGAFTGAATAKPGLIEAAGRGTLFLDEIGDTDRDVQAKLLEVIEERSFRRLGAVQQRHSEARILAATLHDLGERVRRGRFREDLFYRISTLPLRIPPLRERRDDIAPLARRMLEEISARSGRPGLELSRAAEEVLEQYAWPGNLRQLANVLERAAVLTSSLRIEVASLRFEGIQVPPPSELDEVLTLEEMQRAHIERVLRLESGHVGRSASRLGVPRSTLYELVRRKGIRRKEM
ncbi:MAG: sigma-54 dependent transcriptional regulator, partial [Candidatus Eisenbacteria bacterium]